MTPFAWSQEHQGLVGVELTDDNHGERVID
jgi:hypothetical protein